MKNPVLVLALCLALAGSAFAQRETTPKGKRSDEIMLRMRQVDLLVRILPLGLTKAQLKELLPAVEKARAREREIIRLEDDDLAKIGGRLDETVAKGIDNGTYPDKKFLNEVARFTAALGIRRQAALGEMIEMVYVVVNRQLDAGQKKVMANTLNPKLLDPSLKPEEMNDEAKIRFFIRMTLLDDAAYELLKKLYLRPDPPADKPVEKPDGGGAGGTGAGG